MFAKHVLANSGSINPLIIPASETAGLGLMNPSILNDNGKLIVNLRQVNYTFYHSESKLFQHPYGPLTYIHPEDDLYLRTTNWYLELDDNLAISRHTKIDTSRFDTYKPQWDFVGLEDARLVRWDGKLYATGVRRDTTTNGEGRMELSELEVTPTTVTEISRFRIPTPRDPNSYCEKNWMPVVNKPNHFVKWTNPTELVVVDPVNKACKTIFDGKHVNIPIAQRGGTQILEIDRLYIAMTHEVDLFNSETGRKDAVYRHRFIIWDKDWNLVKWSNAFSIMGGHVEFAVGMCQWNDSILITFGFQDNAAYLIKTNKKTIVDFINENS